MLKMAARGTAAKRVLAWGAYLRGLLRIAPNLALSAKFDAMHKDCCLAHKRKMDLEGKNKNLRTFILEHIERKGESGNKGIYGPLSKD